MFDQHNALSAAVVLQKEKADKQELFPDLFENGISVHS